MTGIFIRVLKEGKWIDVDIADKEQLSDATLYEFLLGKNQPWLANCILTIIRERTAIKCSSPILLVPVTGVVR